MLFDHKYPYTDFHELNLDWILCKMRELDSTLTEFTTLNKLNWCGTWDISKSYSAWSLVEDGEGNGYVSTGPVPAGVQLTDTKYWQKVANYSALYSAFEQRIELLEDGEAEIKTKLNEELTAEKEAREHADTALLNSVNTVSDTLNAFTKADVQNLGAVIKKQFWVGDNQTYSFPYNAQGSCYDTKRNYIYIGGNDNTDVGGLLVLNTNFEPIKQTTVSGGGHMNDMTYIESTDEVYVGLSESNKIAVFDPSNWTLKRYIEPDTNMTGYWIAGIATDGTRLFIDYFVNSPNFDLPCYMTDLEGKNAVKIGSLNNSKIMNFNATYPGSSANTDFYNSGIEYYDGKIYSAQFYIEDAELMVPNRISVFNAETCEYVAGYDFMAAKYQELESIFKIGNELYLVSWESDWTVSATKIITIRSITPNINTASASMVPVPKLYEFNMEFENNVTKQYHIPHIPSGIYLCMFNTTPVEYESNRFARCRILTNYDTINMCETPSNQYLLQGFNASFIITNHSPMNITIDWIPITSSSFTLTAYLKLIPLGNFTDWQNIQTF